MGQSETIERLRERQLADVNRASPPFVSRASSSDPWRLAATQLAFDPYRDRGLRLHAINPYRITPICLLLLLWMKRFASASSVF